MPSQSSNGLTDVVKVAAAAQLEAVAADLRCSLAQMAIAWVARNPRVSMVITGASQIAQLRENLGALDVLPKLTPEVLARIDLISAPLAL